MLSAINSRSQKLNGKQSLGVKQNIENQIFQKI